ncbi:MAG: hypothetical protein JHC33_03490 [Ignisphaera sp.]|jgi:hypothetical protein|nr:hypothetical protein [Ignisphaera sp.]
MNKRDLKAYSRFDGTGRIVPGSTVLRRQKPKVGNWKEVPAYECCNDVTLTFTPSSPIISDVTLRLFCNGTQINYLYTPSDSTTIESLVNILNNTFNVLGTFTNPSGNIIQLVMSGAQKTALCPVGTLTFDVIAD